MSEPAQDFGREETAPAYNLTSEDRARALSSTAAASLAAQRTLARASLGLGALVCLIAVAAGAFGAHALRDRLTPDLLTVFETGARYQMYHGLALLGLAAAAAANLIGRGTIRAVLVLMLAGTVIFSGSLYILALTGVRVWGAVTPVGGLLQIAGWTVLAVGTWRHGRPRG